MRIDGFTRRASDLTGSVTSRPWGAAEEMTRPAAVEVSRVQWRGALPSTGRRSVPEETPIALTYNGSAYAVMMATPADLADFAIGFSLAEGVVETPSEVASLDIVEVAGGVEARMWLEAPATARHRASPHFSRAS